MPTLLAEENIVPVDAIVFEDKLRDSTQFTVNQRKALNEVEAFNITGLGEPASDKVAGEDFDEYPNLAGAAVTNTWLHVWDNMLGNEITGFDVLK